MELSWEKVSARLQPATAGHARLVLSKTVLFSAQLCTCSECYSYNTLSVERIVQSGPWASCCEKDVVKCFLKAWAARQLQYSPTACGTPRKHSTKPFSQPYDPDCRFPSFLGEQISKTPMERLPDRPFVPHSDNRTGAMGLECPKQKISIYRFCPRFGG